MSKLLRNPWIVGSLVMGMAALWWVQMHAILFPGATAEPVAALASDAAHETVNSANSDTAATAETLVIEPLPARVAAPTQLRWDRATVRDPFAPLAVSAAVVTPLPVAVTPVEAASVVTIEVEPNLEAVLNTPSAQIAVIDGRIVRVGDKVSGRPVLKIDSASVALGRGPEASEPLLLKLPAR